MHTATIWRLFTDPHISFWVQLRDAIYMSTDRKQREKIYDSCQISGNVARWHQTILYSALFCVNGGRGCRWQCCGLCMQIEKSPEPHAAIAFPLWPRTRQERWHTMHNMGSLLCHHFCLLWLDCRDRSGRALVLKYHNCRTNSDNTGSKSHL